MADNMLNQNETGKNDKDKKLVKYKVKVKCWWNERLYLADDVAELPENVTPPKEYFTKL